MFIAKKQFEKLLRDMEDRAEEKWQTAARGWEETNQSIGQLKAAVQKHDMAIEDLLEEWEEQETEKDGLRKSMQDCERSGKLLLELFEAYQDQFWNLKRFAEKRDETWSAQIALMEQRLEQCRQLCGVSIIETCGVEADSQLHEVIGVVDTTEREKDRLIAEIINWGYLYKGRVGKKAQVTAYRAVGAGKLDSNE